MVAELDNKTAHRQQPVLERHASFFDTFLNAREITFRTRSSFGKALHFLMAARNTLFSMR